ncbi:MAG: polyprenyl synthetase family protein [Candidatus Omnitrophota bacterium]
MNINKYLNDRKKIVDEALDSCLPAGNEYPKAVHSAMRYSVFSGGKRVRPILVLASCEVCGGRLKEALTAACAIEMAHTYSLIHDDLPAMDDDDYRRGKLTCHKKYGEATAILAGDALLTFAMELFCGGKNPKANNETIKVVTRAIGTYGMIGGQVVDIEKRREADLPTLTYINAHKTGALISASCRVGAIAARASKRKLEVLERYGEYIGFTFQVIDDILDKEGFALVLGVKTARMEAARLIEKAKGELKIFDKRADVLRDLADFILNRRK